jgi:hypothetical protein
MPPPVLGQRAASLASGDQRMLLHAHRGPPPDADIGNRLAVPLYAVTLHAGAGNLRANGAPVLRSKARCVSTSPLSSSERWSDEERPPAQTSACDWTGTPRRSPPRSPAADQRCGTKSATSWAISPSATARPIKARMRIAAARDRSPARAQATAAARGRARVHPSRRRRLPT